MKETTSLLTFIFIFLNGLTAIGQMSPELRAKLIARAASFEIKGERKMPPGDALSHNTAGYAKIMCSAVFITGLKPDFAAENIGYFSSPYSERAKVGKPVVDYEKKSVSITLPNGVTRTAIYAGDQGCVCLSERSNSLQFNFVKVPRNLPDAATTPYPMGDVLPQSPMPSEINMPKMEQAIKAAFELDEAQTAAFVVAYKAMGDLFMAVCFG